MSPGLVRSIAVACLLGCGVLVLHALLLGFHIEPTAEALADAAKGEQVAFFAIPGAIAAVAALVGARHRWGAVALVAALLLGATALVLDIVR